MSDNNVLPVGYVLRGPELTYKIVSVLGRGGFGITYLAEATVRVGNVSARMRFAIKEHFMSGECEREGESMRVVCSNPVRERVQSSLKDFISEARRLHKVGVDHPNIVKVNEVFEANGTAYYVMECLEGESLRAYVKRRGPLREEEMLAVMRPVVDAVRYLHAARMTHLDIKPDNIMLTHDEADRLRPVLIDFGLAKHYGKDGSPTSTINILGCSDGYAPMEQYAGITSFSPEADCYALGATMWFCLTGKTPKKSTDLVEGELAREIADDVSPATLEMITSACRLNRRERSFPGLTAPAGATTDWHAPSPSTKTKLIDKPRRRLPWRAIAAAVIALPSLALIVALFAFRGCGSDPAALPAAADSVCTDTVTPDTIRVETLPLFSTTPINFALCAEDENGRFVYITDTQWTDLTLTQKNQLKPLGVYIADGFVVELHDKGKMTWASAKAYKLPTKTQGEIIIKNVSALNDALRAFGGTAMVTWYWTKTIYSDTEAWEIMMNYKCMDSAGFYENRMVRQVIMVKEDVLPRFSKSPVDMALCAKGPDGYVYITAEQWKKIPAEQKSTFEPRGVYLAAGNFLVELHNKGRNNIMEWETALKYNLPTEVQGEIMVKNKKALNNALRAFGGSTMDNLYWTKTEYKKNSFEAWIVFMHWGYVDHTSKVVDAYVRAVAPVPTVN